MKAIYLYGPPDIEEAPDRLVAVFSDPAAAEKMRLRINPSGNESYIADVDADPEGMILFHMNFSLYGCFEQDPIPPHLESYDVSFDQAKEGDVQFGAMLWTFDVLANDYTEAYNTCVEKLANREVEYLVLMGKRIETRTAVLLPMEKLR